MPVVSRVGPYSLVAPLGSDGTVYRGTGAQPGDDVLVWLLAVDRVPDGPARQRLLEDVRVAATLEHPNLLRVRAFVEDGAPALVTDVPEGHTLAERLATAGPLPLEDALDVAAQLCEALQHAHGKGLVHGALGARDITLADDGTATIDTFGYAGVRATQAGHRPARGARRAGVPLPDDDLHAVADVLEEMLTGTCEPRGEAAIAAWVRETMLVAYDGAETGTGEGVGAAIARARAGARAGGFEDAAAFGRELTTLRLALPRHTPPPPRAVRPSASATSAATSAGPTVAALGANLAVQWAGVLALCSVGLAISLYLVPGPSAPPPAQPAAGAQPAASLVSLAVDSVPAGAAVRIDGVDIGRQTPTTIQVPAGSTPQVELHRDGYVAAAILVDAADLQRGRLELELQPDQAPADQGPVTVALVGDYPFEVLDDQNVRISAAARQHQVTTELRSLRIEAPRFFLRRSVPVPAGGGTITAPRLTTLSVRSNVQYARCSIFVDGIATDQYPGEGQLTVAQGTHQVALKCPDGRRIDPQRVEVGPAGGVVKFPRF